MGTEDAVEATSEEGPREMRAQGRIPRENQIPTVVRPPEGSTRKVEEEGLSEAQAHLDLHGPQPLQELTPAAHLLRSQGSSNASKGPRKACRALQRKRCEASFRAASLRLHDLLGLASAGVETTEERLRLSTYRLCLARKRSQAKDRQNVLPAQVPERPLRARPQEELHGAVEHARTPAQDEGLRCLQENEASPLAAGPIGADTTSPRREARHSANPWLLSRIHGQHPSTEEEAHHHGYSLGLQEAHLGRENIPLLEDLPHEAEKGGADESGSKGVLRREDIAAH